MPTHFIFFFNFTLFASQLCWVSREKDAVVYARFGVSGELSVLFKHFLHELCFLKVYYKHCQVTHVFFLPVHVDLFASVLTRSTCKANLIKQRISKRVPGALQADLLST